MELNNWLHESVMTTSQSDVEDQAQYLCVLPSIDYLLRSRSPIGEVLSPVKDIPPPPDDDIPSSGATTPGTDVYPTEVPQYRRSFDNTPPAVYPSSFLQERRPSILPNYPPNPLETKPIPASEISAPLAVYPSNFLQERRPSRQPSFTQGHPPNPLETTTPIPASDISTSPSTFNYHPLESDEHIRALKVLQGEYGSPLDCELISFNLAESFRKKTVRYAALSYYWGTDEAHNEIQIRRFPKDSAEADKFFVKSNLFAALQQFRRKDRPVTLWIDAICIDQKNNAEKAHQISKMQEIYNTATNVCIWLGPATPTSDIALLFIKEVLDLEGFDNLIKDELNLYKWFALAELMRNRWFTRRWVIQEVSMARNATVHCGSQVVHWTDFADAVTLFVSRLDQIQQLFPLSASLNASETLTNIRVLGASALVNISNSLFRKSPEGEILERLRTMETLVSTLLSFEATDPKDTVYAILSLAKDEPDHKIEPDYRKDLVEVCTDFIKSCVDSSSSLDIICRHWVPIDHGVGTFYSKDSRNMPSWIPSILGSSFGAPEDALNGRINGDSFVGDLGRQNYNATLGFPPVSVTFGLFSRDPIFQTLHKKFDGTMRVKGFRLNTITELGPRAAEGFIFRECLEMGGLSRNQKETPLRVPDELWRTLVADRAPDGSNPPSWYHRAFLYCLAKRTTGGDINTGALIKSEESPQMMVEFLKRVQSIIWNRKFFRSSSEPHLFGLTPAGAKEGDIVAILYGCSVPVVLRQHGVARPAKRKREPVEPYIYVEFIGECYVYGMMDGEARSIKERDRTILEEEFIIR
jgi:hypothetical protein